MNFLNEYIYPRGYSKSRIETRLEQKFCKASLPPFEAYFSRVPLSLPRRGFPIKDAKKGCEGQVRERRKGEKGKEEKRRRKTHTSSLPPFLSSELTGLLGRVGFN